MRIDTNELHRWECTVLPLREDEQRDLLEFVRTFRPELDRLYAIEAANNPMTREQIEAWLKENGWGKNNVFRDWTRFNSAGLEEYFWFSREDTRVHARFKIGDRNTDGHISEFPIESVTPALLSALLK